MGIFPPTGLEYIAASMKDLIGKVTLLDLRYERAYQNPTVLGKLIRADVDLLCISMGWHSRFKDTCDFVSRLPCEVTTVVGGHTATQEVERLFARCPNIDMIARGEGEEIIVIVYRVSGPKGPEVLTLASDGSIVAKHARCKG